MKHQILPVMLLCAAMLTPALPANALEDGAQVTFRLQPENAAVAADGCVHLSAAEAAAGKTLHIGMYITSDSPEINRIGVRIQSDHPELTFAADSIRTAKTTISEEPVAYRDEASGVTFSTTFFPYCLGTINSKGEYLPDCFSCNTNLTSDTDLYIYWLYGIGNAGSFVGSKSDSFSFCAFDAVLASGTAPGTYALNFIADEQEPYPEAEHLTALTWDSGTTKEPDYHRMVPGLEGLRIVVDPEPARQPVKGDVNADGVINAEDATEILKYAAKNGTGGSGITQEEHDRFLTYGDVSGDGVVNANDATGILRYAASVGTGTPLTWEEIFS